MSNGWTENLDESPDRQEPLKDLSQPRCQSLWNTASFGKTLRVRLVATTGLVDVCSEERSIPRQVDDCCEELTVAARQILHTVKLN